MSNLQKVRKEKGLSQLKLSMMTGIAPGDISCIENDRLRPYPGWRKRLTRVLGVSEQELFPDEQTVGSLLLQNSECPTMTIPEFAEATGCSRNLAFHLARQDRLPVKVIFIGQKRMCVSRQAVLALLSGDTQKKGGR